MSKLSDAARVSLRPGPEWRSCAGCGELFPAGPEEVHCRDCARTDGRCGAAHPEDRSPCDGPADAVRVLDQLGGQRHGCVRHASVLLASVRGARVYPGSVPGAAVAAFDRAQQRAPFSFDRPLPAAGGGGR